MCLYVSVCLCVYLPIYLYVYMSFHVYVCISLSVSFASACLCLGATEVETLLKIDFCRVESLQLGLLGLEQEGADQAFQESRAHPAGDGQSTGEGPRPIPCRRHWPTAVIVPLAIGVEASLACGSWDDAHISTPHNIDPT